MSQTINKQTYYLLRAIYPRAINGQTHYLLPSTLRLQPHPLVHNTPRQRWGASHAAIMILRIMMPLRVTRRLVGGIPQTPTPVVSK